MKRPAAGGDRGEGGEPGGGAWPEPRPPDSTPRVLDPVTLGDHIDVLYRAAWALCGSRADAEDLVQETLARVLTRRRVVRSGNERAYLLRALKNTHVNQYRARTRRPATVSLTADHARPEPERAAISARELMEAVAAAPPVFREAVIAVDVLGLSYREAARWLHTGPETIASRVHRGRQHVARELIERGFSSPTGATSSAVRSNVTCGS